MTAIQAVHAEGVMGAVGLAAPVDLRISCGEKVALVGPNGAGKTSLIKLLCGARPLTGGTVRLMGEAVRPGRARAVARVAAVIHQAPPAAFGFTVREAVALGRLPHEGDRGGAAVIDAALTAAHLDELAERSVTTLSGGERQRVALARALAQQTPLLLMDEATAHLDVAQQGRLLAMAVTGAPGLKPPETLVAVLHDLNLAARGFDRIVLMHRGRVVADGAPSAVLTEAILKPVFGEGITVFDHADGGPVILPVLSSSGLEG